MIKRPFGRVGFAGGVYYFAIVGFCEWRMGGKNKESNVGMFYTLITVNVAKVGGRLFIC